MAATETNGRATTDIDAEETRDWLESLDSVLRNDGADRARFLLERLVAQAGRVGASPPLGGTTPYVNTIPVDQEPEYPGDEAVERRIRTLIRWNAMATVLQANKESSELGGHIASYQSAATLYEVGFNHFWHAPSEEHGGDLVFMQGHSAPGFYARAFLEGRMSEDQLRRFRQEIGENGGFDGDGISSYPHPWLMPDFWQFPTVSMGLGPIMAIYQARFMKYLQGREIADTDGPQGVGLPRRRRDRRARVARRDLDGRPREARQPDLRRQLQPAAARRAGARQRQDHPGARDRLPRRGLERDQGRLGLALGPAARARHRGPLLARMEEAVDGEYQTFKARDGAYVREHFFGKDPKLLEMVADMSDDEIWALNRGGHDPQKIHAAYAAAVAHKGQPTVILAKTIKGYGMGEAGEGQNITHQQKKMTENALLAFRDRFELDLTDEQVHDGGFHRPPEDSAGDDLPARAPRGARRRAAGAAREGRGAGGAGAVRPSARSCRAAASARSPPRWRSSASSTRCCATSRSAATSSRSCPTSRARSAWRACSASSGSSARSASSTSPRTPTSSCSTRRTRRARSSRRASTSRARSPPGSPRRRRTPTTTCR